MQACRLFCLCLGLSFFLNASGQNRSNKLFFAGSVLLTAKDSASLKYDIDSSGQNVKMTIKVQELDNFLELSRSKNEKDFVRIEFSKEQLLNNIFLPKFTIENFPTEEDMFQKFQEWVNNRSNNLIVKGTARQRGKGKLYSFTRSFQTTVRTRIKRKSVDRLVKLRYDCTFMVNKSGDKLIRYDISNFIVEGKVLEAVFIQRDKVFSGYNKKEILDACINDVDALLNSLSYELPGEVFNSVINTRSDNTEYIFGLIK